MQEAASLANLDDPALFFGNAQPQPRLGSLAARHRPPQKPQALTSTLPSQLHCAGKSSITPRIVLASQIDQQDKPCFPSSVVAGHSRAARRSRVAYPSIPTNHSALHSRLPGISQPCLPTATATTILTTSHASCTTMSMGRTTAITTTMNPPRSSTTSSPRTSTPMASPAARASTHPTSST